jgi:hypothetical protein
METSRMLDLKDMYGRLDDWMRRSSRGQYAILTGLACTLGVLVISLALDGHPDYVSALTMGFTLTVLNYWLNPNTREE